MAISTRTLAEGDGFVVDSVGNGFAYAFTDTLSGRSVWLQGDDAADFRRELFARSLSALWQDYDQLAR